VSGAGTRRSSNAKVKFGAAASESTIRMTRRPHGHVSLVVQFLPQEVRDAARELSSMLDGLADVVMSLDAHRGHLELANVRGVDLRLLTEWLYRRGARGVFVRYQHEAWPEAAFGAAVAAAPLN
jgi:hypothetical protein